MYCNFNGVMNAKLHTLKIMAYFILICTFIIENQQQMNEMLFLCFFWGSYLVTRRSYSWLHNQESLLAVENHKRCRTSNPE